SQGRSYLSPVFLTTVESPTVSDADGLHVPGTIWGNGEYTNCVLPRLKSLHWHATIIRSTLDRRYESVDAAERAEGPHFHVEVLTVVLVGFRVHGDLMGVTLHIGLPLRLGDFGY